MTETRTRRPRSDRGPRLTERDLRVLRWIAEQYVCRLDMVQALLSPDDDHLISETRLRQILARWQAGGWIDMRRWLAGEPAWVWVTAAGLRLLDLDGDFKALTPAVTRLEHCHAINGIRRYVERSGRWPGGWLSERWLRSGLKQTKGTHPGPVPDGEVTGGHGRIAVEIELTPKKRADLVSKLAALAYKTELEGYQRVRSYHTIWVFVPTAAMVERVKQASEGLRDDEQKRVVVYLLSQYM